MCRCEKCSHYQRCKKKFKTDPKQKACRNYRKAKNEN